MNKKKLPFLIGTYPDWLAFSIIVACFIDMLVYHFLPLIYIIFLFIPIFTMPFSKWLPENIYDAYFRVHGRTMTPHADTHVVENIKEANPSYANYPSSVIVYWYRGKLLEEAIPYLENQRRYKYITIKTHILNSSFLRLMGINHGSMSKYSPGNLLRWCAWVPQHLSAGGTFRSGFCRLRQGIYLAKVPIEELGEWKVLTDIEVVNKAWVAWLAEIKAKSKN